jgi:hypothetical protein
MQLLQTLNTAFRYVSEAIMRIFAPSHDHYPATGMLPFQGDFHGRSQWAD